MKKRVITMAVVGVMAVSSIGGATVFAAQQKTANTKSVCTNVSTITSTLHLNFDNTKFELVQPEGQDTIYLADKADEKGRNTIVYISWEHLNGVTADEAAKNEIKTIRDYDGIAEIEASDLQLKSIKVVGNYKDVSYMTYYFINDNNGGVYKIFVNTNAFTNESEMTDILKSISVDDKATDTLKIKRIAPCEG